jgi:hypothetical protein
VLDHPHQPVSTNLHHHHRHTRAREAAEALFKPKAQTVKKSLAESATSGDRSLHKPRILSIASNTPASSIVQTDTGQTEDAPTIPMSERRRIRTWLQYGMTVPQVAKVYCVAVDEVEAILGEVC